MVLPPDQAYRAASCAWCTSVYRTAGPGTGRKRQQPSGGTSCATRAAHASCPSTRLRAMKAHAWACRLAIATAAILRLLHAASCTMHCVSRTPASARLWPIAHHTNRPHMCGASVHALRQSRHPASTLGCRASARRAALGARARYAQQALRIPAGCMRLQVVLLGHLRWRTMWLPYTPKYPIPLTLAIAGYHGRKAVPGRAEPCYARASSRGLRGCWLLWPVRGGLGMRTGHGGCMQRPGAALVEALRHGRRPDLDKTRQALVGTAPHELQRAPGVQQLARQPARALALLRGCLSIPSCNTPSVDSSLLATAHPCLATALPVAILSSWTIDSKYPQAATQHRPLTPF